MRTILLAVLLLMPAAAAAEPATVNLRNYWLLGEVVDSATGRTASFRIDCTAGEPLLCRGGKDDSSALMAWIGKTRRLQKEGGADTRAPPALLEVMATPVPGYVGLIAAGAGGWKRDPVDTTAGGLLPAVARPAPAPLEELRAPGGYTTAMDTFRGGKEVASAHHRLTVWLRTPGELAGRDAVPARKPPLPGDPLNFRNYWLLGEVVDSATGRTASFRIDCTAGEPLLCRGGKDDSTALMAWSQAIKRQGGGADTRTAPALLEVGATPAPGYVGLIAAAAGGWKHGGEAWLGGVHGVTKPAPAPLEELRAPGGYTTAMDTFRGIKEVASEHHRLTVWLVTPGELAVRERKPEPEAAGDAEPPAADKTSGAEKKGGLLDRLRSLF